mgnify:CR=1 FL=1
MKKITALLYDDFTALDLFGPLEALSRLPDHEVRYTSLDGGAVTNHTGLSVSTEKVSQDVHSDILLLPGGFGSRKMVNDRVFLQTLRTMSAHADFVLSVCTGSALLARAGVLEGRKATAHAGFQDQLAGAEVLDAEVVVDGNITTSYGLGGAIPFALELVRQLAGQAEADRIRNAIAYRH